MKNILKLQKGNTKEVFAWSMYDFANSAFATTILAVIFNAYFAEIVAGGAKGVDINLFGFNIHLPGSSLFSFSLSIAMFIVALTGPILGAIADFSNSKKKFLFFYCFVGCLFTGLLYFVREGNYIIGSLFFIISCIGFEGGNVFYNAFLLEIAEQSDMGKVSGFGWAIGYIGGGLCLLLNLIMLNSPRLLGFSEGFFSVNSIFLSVAIWWAVFSVPIFLFVKEKNEKYNLPEKKSYISIGFGRIRNTFKKIRNYTELVKFLIAYLIYNDGIQTVIVMASIFGAEVLKMNETERIEYFLVIQATAFAGSLFFGYLSDKINNKKTILITLFIWSLVVIWAYFLGIFFKPIFEFWIIGILAGLVMGGSQAASRSLQASFTPKNNSAEFFGFFAVSGKFASVVGPFLYGLIILITGSLKNGIFSLIIFFIIGIILLLFVNEKEGIKQKESVVT